MLLFAISSFGTKVIGFLLVPLYTHCLTTAEYGTADMVYTIVQLAVPVLSVDIADGVIRFVLEKDRNASSVLLTALKVISLGSVILLFLIFGIRATHYIVLEDKYYGFIFLNFVFISLYHSFVNYLKGKEHIKDLVIAGIMSSLLNAGCNILFLVRLDMGVDGYLTAHVIAIAIPLFYLLIRAWSYGYMVFSGIKADKELEKEMLLYSAPLILNGVAWWINNSLDRVCVILICGASANGLLAVAYKIPSILSMMQNIFNQAWSLSAIQEFDPEDKNGFMSHVYSYYGCAMVLSSSALLLVNVFLAKLIYANDFFMAWQFTGMLILAHLFGGLNVCISGVFNAVKDTKTLATTTGIGAVVNLILNLLLITAIGVQGAVVSTMVSTMVIWILRMHKVRSYIKIKINILRDSVSYVFLIAQCVFGLTPNHLYTVQVAICLILIALYRKEVIVILNNCSTRLKSLRGVFR